jgi:hypothetical protein
MLPPGGRNWQLISTHWEFVKSILPSGFSSLGVLNKDPLVWVDGARLAPISFIGLPLPQNEFSKIKI